MSDLHFLRPEWLWALVPAVAVVALVWHGARAATERGWTGTVDAHLLKHLTVGGNAARPSRGLVAALAAGLLAAVLAMAGPAWEKLPTPTTRGAEPVVVVLSLAQSMNGADLVPSRLARAGHKLRDILDRAIGEDVGLVIYADRPFVAAPLTPDGDVIAEMLPELSTNLMPVLGNRLNLAIDEAHNLLSSAGATRGRILVMADDLGADPDASRAAARSARADGYAVSVLGVGTTEGAALQTADGRVISVGGAAQVARLDSSAMQGLAEAGGGRYAEVTATSADLDRLLPATIATTQPGHQSDLKADRWYDRGYLLLLVPVLLMPFAFRRGVLFAVMLALVGFGTTSGSARAAGLDDLWATPDQQGARAFAQGDYAAAAAAFVAPDWRAGALYRAGDYEAAAKGFGNDGYNAGNALARAGRFEEALAAYDNRLATAPEDADAQFNRDLVAKLLEDQKAEEKQQQQDQQQQSQSGEDQQQQDQSGGNPQQQQDQQQTGQSDQQQQQGQSGEDQQQAGQSGENAQQPSEQAGSDQQQGQPDAGQPQQEAQSQKAEQASGQQQQQAGQSGDEKQQGQTDEQQSDQSADKNQAGAPDPQQQAEQSGDMTGDQSEPQDTSKTTSQAGTPQAAQPSDDTQDTGTLSAMIDRMLQGNGADEDEGDEPAQAAAATATPLSQSAEQQLRAVPDDPSGLLRARIRQHYAQLRANGQ